MIILKYRMTNFKLIVAISFFIFFSCKQKETKNSPAIKVVSIASNEIEKLNFIAFFMGIPKAIFPFTNDTLDKYIVFNKKYDYDASTETTSLLHNKLLVFENASKFASKNQLLSYRPSSETSEYLKGNYFYPVNKFRKDSIYLITYLYQDFEDIMPAIKTQLNSYDKNGNILDTLLLDNRFSFELIYKNDFLIKNDFSIKITENVISYYDDMDNLIPKGSIPKVDKKTSFYRLDNNGKFGKFEK